MAGRGRDVTVILVDVGYSMSLPVPGMGKDGGSKADAALGFARSIAQQKLIFLPKHEVAVVFFGTVETRNDLQSDGYENITVVNDGALRNPDLDMLKFLTHRPKGGEDSDAVGALIVALDVLIKRTRDVKCARTVYVLTDDASLADGDEDLQECLRQLEVRDAKLRVCLLAASQGSPWAKVAFASSVVELVPPPVLARSTGRCAKPVELRAKVRLPLEIAPSFHIPVGVYTRTTRVSFPTLKKASKVVANVPVAGSDAPADKVIVERTYHVADDPDGEAVAPEDRIKGHRYGSSIVPMSEYDEAALMYTCERTLVALGFAEADAVGPEHNMYHIDVVAADRGDTWATTVFESLVEAMVLEKVVLIARYAFRKNAQPRMVALVPRKGTPGFASILEMQYLPFFEDIREWTCASLPATTAEQRTAAERLVDAMILDADGKPGAVAAPDSLFRPEDTGNPALARFYAFLVQRAMEPSAKVPSADSVSWNHVRRPAWVDERLVAGKVGDLVKAQFKCEKVEKPSARRKLFWREAVAEKRKELALEEVDTKRIKVPERKKEEKEEEEEKVKREDSPGRAAFSGMAAPVGPPPSVHVGSVHPERDFERWLTHKAGGHDTAVEAIRQMCAVIQRLADEGEDFFGKALGCLTALRRGCVQVGEAAAYNVFVRTLSRASSPRHSRFWSRATALALGLVTDGEVPTSTVTAEEAAAFLRGEAYVPSTAASSAPRPGTASAPEPSAVHLTEQDLEAMMD